MKALMMKKLASCVFGTLFAIGLSAGEDAADLLKQGLNAWNASPRRAAEAAQAFDKAAQTGSAEGQMWSALCYMQGVGVKADLAKAVRLMRQAAASSADAQFLLGLGLVDIL